MSVSHTRLPTTIGRTNNPDPTLYACPLSLVIFAFLFLESLRYQFIVPFLHSSNTDPDSRHFSYHIAFPPSGPTCDSSLPPRSIHPQQRLFLYTIIQIPALSMDLGQRSILNPSDENHTLIPRKRRRSSAHYSSASPHTMKRDQDNDVRMTSDPYIKAQENGTMTVSTKLADRNVAPFLAKHIPEQHTGSDISSTRDKPHDHRDQSSVHCCRHRSEIKCRRQADESTMDQLQRVSVTSSLDPANIEYRLTSHSFLNHIGTTNPFPG